MAQSVIVWDRADMGDTVLLDRQADAATRARDRLPLAVGAGASAVFLARILVTGNPFGQLFSEDGVFWERSHHGLDAFRPLGGYLHLIPATIWTLGRPLPMWAAPAWTTLTMALVVGALTAFVFVAARRLTGTGPALLAAAALPLTAALRDDLGGLAWAQWFVGPACFWALLRPWRGKLGVAAVVVALVGSLSSAVAIVLLSVGIIRRSWWATAAFAAGQAAQLAVLVTGPKGALRETTWPGSGRVLTRALVWVTGYLPADPRQQMIAAAGGLVIACAVLASVALARERLDPALAIGVAAAFLAVTVYISAQVPPRYVAWAMMLGVFAVALALPTMRAGRRIVVAVLVTSAVVAFPSSTYRFEGPRWQCVDGRAYVTPADHFPGGFAC